MVTKRTKAEQKLCLILNDPLADDEAALAHIRGATGL
jgi:hypothetical protein